MLTFGTACFLPGASLLDRQSCLCPGNGEQSGCELSHQPSTCPIHTEMIVVFKRGDMPNNKFASSQKFYTEHWVHSDHSDVTHWLVQNSWQVSSESGLTMGSQNWLGTSKLIPLASLSIHLQRRQYTTCVCCCIIEQKKEPDKLFFTFCSDKKTFTAFERTCISLLVTLFTRFLMYWYVDCSNELSISGAHFPHISRTTQFIRYLSFKPF